jgi:glutathione S-transferase
MRLITTQGAPNPQRLDIFLHEKSIELTRTHINLMEREHDDESFRAKSPFGRVPVLLLDDETPIGEVEAIARYFEEVVPEPSLFGLSPRDKALVSMWAGLTEFELMTPIAHAFRHGHPRMGVLEEQVADYALVAAKKASYGLGVFANHMQHRDYVCLDHFTFADINAVVALRMTKLAKIDLNQWPVLQKWLEKMCKRPSIAALDQ